MEKNYLCYVGIDVSKSKLDVSFLNQPLEKHPKHFVVSNNQKGISLILYELQKLALSIEDVLFCFEDTGVYSLSLSYFFSENNLDYWMIPAIEIKRSKGISRGKTDKADSKDIAFYAKTHRHKLRLSSLAAKDIMELKLLFSEREKVLKAIRLFESTQENIGYLPSDILNSTLKMNGYTLRSLKNTLQKIESKMQDIINNNSQLSNQFELITSVPGIGTQTAIYLLLVTKGFHSFSNWRKLACYAGVAPFEYSSGSSVRGRTKVNHLADKKLKSLLNMCAMNAKKCDKELKAYYEKKTAEGKSKMLVLNNIRCKLLARVFAVINRDQPYVNTRKFAA